MSLIYKRKKILLPSDVIYQVITDVEKYPEFLPWCEKVSLFSQESGCFVADLEIRFKSYIFSYRSEVEHFISFDDLNLEQKIYTVNTKAYSQDLHYLNNCWRIRDFIEYSLVEFMIDVSFKSFWLNTLFKVMKNIAQNKILDSFISRAKVLSSK